LRHDFTDYLQYRERTGGFTESGGRGLDRPGHIFRPFRNPFNLSQDFYGIDDGGY
jgi:hypothetical protein